MASIAHEAEPAWVSPIGSLHARARSIPLSDREEPFTFRVEQDLLCDAEFVLEVLTASPGSTRSHAWHRSSAE